MNRSPAFQFYAEKWIAHTRHLSDAACRIYHDLLCWMWLHSGTGYTVKRDAVATAVARSKEATDSAMVEIMSPHMPLLKIRRGLLVSDGLRKEVEKQKEWRRKSSEGGRKSASMRGCKPLGVNHPSTTVPTKGQPPPQPNGNTLTLSLSQSLPTVKIERESSAELSPLMQMVRDIQAARPDWTLNEVHVATELHACQDKSKLPEIVRQFTADAANGDRPRNPIGMLRGYVSRANAPESVKFLSSRERIAEEARKAAEEAEL